MTLNLASHGSASHGMFAPFEQHFVDVAELLIQHARPHQTRQVRGEGVRQDHEDAVDLLAAQRRVVQDDREEETEREADEGGEGGEDERPDRHPQQGVADLLVREDAGEVVPPDEHAPAGREGLAVLGAEVAFPVVDVDLSGLGVRERVGRFVVFEARGEDVGVLAVGRAERAVVDVVGHLDVEREHLVLEADDLVEVQLVPPVRRAVHVLAAAARSCRTTRSPPGSATSRPNWSPCLST